MSKFQLNDFPDDVFPELDIESVKAETIEQQMEQMRTFVGALYAHGVPSSTRLANLMVNTVKEFTEAVEASDDPASKREAVTQFHRDFRMIHLALAEHMMEHFGKLKVITDELGKRDDLDSEGAETVQLAARLFSAFVESVDNVRRAVNLGDLKLQRQTMQHLMSFKKSFADITYLLNKIPKR